MLEPARAPSAHASLPYACSLCGSCRDVCPVRIDLPKQLLAWRSELLAHAPGGRAQRAALRAARFAFEHPRLYAALGALARFAARALPERWLEARWNPWTRGRALPIAPRRSFREELARRGR